MNGPARSFVGGRPQVDERGNSVSSAGGVETLPRFGLSEFAGVSGQLWVSYVTPTASTTITKIMVASAGAAAVTATLARMALFTVAADDAITLVARTDSDTTIGAATYTPYERALSTVGGYPASYVLSAYTRYAFGFLQVAATAMKPQGAFILDGGIPPVPSRIATGQSDIATGYAVAALPSTFTAVYFRGRP